MEVQSRFNKIQEVSNNTLSGSVIDDIINHNVAHAIGGEFSEKKEFPHMVGGLNNFSK